MAVGSPELLQGYQLPTADCRLIDSSVILCANGKTIRGTISHGLNRGVHLLAAYGPLQGVVLLQVAVEHGVCCPFQRADDHSGGSYTAVGLIW